MTGDVTWAELPDTTRELLTGKLAGLWDATTDAAAFDSWTLDKKQAMLLLLERLQAKGLWHLVKRVTNVYGEGGVGLEFEAWPMVESTLSRLKHFRYELLGKMKPDWRIIAKSLRSSAFLGALCV
jgi:hypothetical protein